MGNIPILAPDMRLRATQRRSDGELFISFKTESGSVRCRRGAAAAIRTRRILGNSYISFRQSPQLTAAEKKEMEKLNPKSPGELKEEKEDERFLKGEEINDQPTQHHHQ